MRTSARVTFLFAALVFVIESIAHAGFVDVRFEAVSTLAGSPVGNFATQGFIANEAVDVILRIDSSTTDFGGANGVGDFRDGTGSYIFVGAISGATLTTGGGVRFVVNGNLGGGGPTMVSSPSSYPTHKSPMR